MEEEENEAAEEDPKVDGVDLAETGSALGTATGADEGTEHDEEEEDARIKASKQGLQLVKQELLLSRDERRGR